MNETINHSGVPSLLNTFMSRKGEREGILGSQFLDQDH